jgi:hypothetical protein
MTATGDDAGAKLGKLGAVAILLRLHATTLAMFNLGENETGLAE